MDVDGAEMLVAMGREGKLAVVGGVEGVEQLYSLHM